MTFASDNSKSCIPKMCNAQIRQCQILMLNIYEKINSTMFLVDSALFLCCLQPSSSFIDEVLLLMLHKKCYY